MRRAQSTLEYAYLIGIVAVAIIATLVYIKRGFQGNLRQLSEQSGAGAYAPGNTQSNILETKHLESISNSSSTSTVISAGPGPDAGGNWALDQVSGTSSTNETGTETVDRQTNEVVGDFSGDRRD